jgi:sulfite dehydrogenase
MPVMERDDAQFSRRGFLRVLGTGATVLAWPGIRGVGAAAAAASISTWDTKGWNSPGPVARYPQKAPLILLTDRPPQLETPIRYFATQLTPAEAFFVRWGHVGIIPTSVDLATWRVRIGGHVQRPLELSLSDLKTGFAQVSFQAVNQCSGNSRRFFDPPVPGGQWGNGAMGNAEWTGVRLRDLLQAAGVKAGAVQVTLQGLDRPVLPQTPQFVKALEIDRALLPDVLVAHTMNGGPLPMLNGFPVRLVVPGWYATYWVKALTTVTVVTERFEGFWMATAYRIPDTPFASVPPGTAPARTVPINRLNIRSFIIQPTPGSRLPRGRLVTLRGFAFDGGFGIQQVLVSTDGGLTWREAALQKDFGRYAFRQWLLEWTPPAPGQYRLMVQAVNTIGEGQSLTPRWNPAGYMWNRVEHADMTVV